MHKLRVSRSPAAPTLPPHIPRAPVKRGLVVCD